MPTNPTQWALLGAVVAAFLLFSLWRFRSRPDDVPKIKTYLEAGGHRVVDIQRDGFVAGGRNGASYRKYRVTVRSPSGGPDAVREIGVAAGLLRLGGNIVEL